MTVAKYPDSTDENAVRYLAVKCGEPVYNMNEEGIEEVKPMHAVLVIGKE